MTSRAAVLRGRCTSSRQHLSNAIVLLVVVMIVVACAGSGTDKGTSEDSKSPARSNSNSAEGDGRSKASSHSTHAGAPEPGACIEPMTAFMSSGHLMPTLVSCDIPHGGEVVAVYDAPDGMDEYPAATRELKGLDVALKSCIGDGEVEGAFGRFAGDNRLKVTQPSGGAGQPAEAWLVSSLQGGLLVPSPSQWDAGERWVVCAAILQHSDEVLSQYNGSAQGILRPGELAAEFAWCKRQLDRNDSRAFVIVSCDQPHSHEQVASFSVGSAEDPYPGEESLGSLAGSVCPNLISTATGGRSDDAADQFELSWTYPIESSWLDGDRTARCYIVGVNGESSGTVGSGTAKFATKGS
ncbi:MAG: septum formation family protein [Microthrixaceae bacterium]